MPGGEADPICKGQAEHPGTSVTPEVIPELGFCVYEQPRWSAQLRYSLGLVSQGLRCALCVGSLTKMRFELVSIA